MRKQSAPTGSLNADGPLQLDCFALGFTLAKLNDLQQKPSMVNPEQLMTQALALASDSLLLTSPNPRVGCDSPQVGDESKALQASRRRCGLPRPPTRKPS